MKMNPMNFMETLGEVRQDYVEEMLNTKANGGITRERGFLMPAFGVLSGVAACAVMVFGIWAVSHPEMMHTVVSAASPAAENSDAQLSQPGAEQDGTAAEAEGIWTETTQADGAGITVEVKEGILTATGCTYLLEDTLPDAVEEGFHYTLLDENGTELAYKDPMESYAPIAQFSYWGTPDEIEYEAVCSLEPYYGALPNGKYTLLISSNILPEISVTFQIG